MSLTVSRRAPFAELVAHRELPNGARFYVLENHFNPTLAISGSLTAGRLFAPAERRLIASVTAGELMNGTARRTKLQLAEDLESRAISLGFSSDASDPVGVDVAGAALSRETDVLLEALAEVLRTPGRFRPTSSSGRRSGSSARSASSRTRPPSGPTKRPCGGCIRWSTRPALHRRGANRAGRGARARGPCGLLRGALRRGVAARSSSWATWTPGGSSIGWRRRSGPGRAGPKPEIPEVPVPPPSPGRETVEMSDKASADVVVMAPADLKRTDPDFFACTLANAALGQSSLTSRLGVRVRDTEGLTYGIHSSFSATHIAGPFTIGLTVKPESRDAALASTLDEVGRLLETGLTPKELVVEKSSRIGKFKVDLGSNAGIANALDSAVYYGFGVSYLDEFPAKVARRDEGTRPTPPSRPGSGRRTSRSFRRGASENQ